MQRYEYLVYSLIFVAIFMLCLRMRKDLRPHVIVPCVIGAFAGPISELLYFNDYWRPYTIFGQARPGIEDILFGSSVIGITLMVYPFLFGKQEWQSHYRRHMTAGILYILLAAIMLLVLNGVLGVNSVVATGMVCLALLVPIIVRRPDLAVPAFLTGVAMATLAALIYFEPISYLHPPQTDKQAGEVNNCLKHTLLPFPAVA